MMLLNYSPVNCFADDGLEDIKEVFKKDCVFAHFLQAVGPHYDNTAKHCLRVKNFRLSCFLIEDESVLGMKNGFFTDYKHQTKKW